MSLLPLSFVSFVFYPLFCVNLACDFLLWWVLFFRGSAIAIADLGIVGQVSGLLLHDIDVSGLTLADYDIH